MQFNIEEFTIRDVLIRYLTYGSIGTFSSSEFIRTSFCVISGEGGNIDTIPGVKSSIKLEEIDSGDVRSVATAVEMLFEVASQMR